MEGKEDFIERYRKNAAQLTHKMAGFIVFVLNTCF